MERIIHRTLGRNNKGDGMTVKFKVWDKEQKIFSISKFYLNQDGEIWFITDDGFYSAADCFEPVFSTGKTDKNGVELFDGDIIDTLGDIFVIVNKRFNDCGYNEVTPGWMDGYKKYIEKIGNKFENPELMETK